MFYYSFDTASITANHCCQFEANLFRLYSPLCDTFTPEQDVYDRQSAATGTTGTLLLCLYKKLFHIVALDTDFIYHAQYGSDGKSSSPVGHPKGHRLIIAGRPSPLRGFSLTGALQRIQTGVVTAHIRWRHYRLWDGIIMALKSCAVSNHAKIDLNGFQISHQNYSTL